MDTRGIQIGVLVVIGALFASLLTFIVYKLWRHTTSYRNKEGNYEKNNVLDALPSNLFNPFALVPIGYHMVPGQKPFERDEENTLTSIESEQLPRKQAALKQVSLPVEPVAKGYPDSPSSLTKQNAEKQNSLPAHLSQRQLSIGNDLKSHNSPQRRRLVKQTAITESPRNSISCRLVHQNSDNSITSAFERSYFASAPDIRNIDAPYLHDNKCKKKRCRKGRQGRSNTIIDLGYGNCLKEEMFTHSMESIGGDELFSSQESLSDSDTKSPKIGKVRFTVQYLKKENKLQIHVIKALDFAPNRSISDLNVFVCVYLLSSVKKRKQYTNCKKDSLGEPFFNEIILFQGLSSEELNFAKLKLKLCVRTRLARKDALGEAELELHSLNEISDLDEYTLSLRQPDSKFRDASIAINAQLDLDDMKLIVIVEEAHLPEAAKLIIIPNLFVTLDVVLGKTLESKHTTTKWKTCNPYFNEQFHFPLSIKNAEDVRRYGLDVSLKHSNLIGRCKTIGHALLSVKSSLDSAKEQWESVISAPNKFHKSHHRLVGKYEV